MAKIAPIPVSDMKATAARLQAVCDNFEELSEHRNGLLDSVRIDVEKVRQYCAQLGAMVPERADIQRLVNNADAWCVTLLQIAEKVHRFADDQQSRPATLHHRKY
ncbi:hypothetical protein JQ616_28930 [Bradyrhizobium tropiciagri]|uniref:hypothetical protein n=1 Tax=Bradyrhizobium tropiciagri TaxID=312253 RepID=UPI001BAC0711|nr:hypothetical protein [Bradyrhizobium tropiciagri]MBR0899000.1 hypothetical protein [Bradyrhizobium tropiciagri]